MTQLDTLPSSIDVGTGETPKYTLDTTNYLGSGQSLQSSPVPTMIIQSAANGATIPNAISSGPTVSGNFLLFTINGSLLQTKQSYTLIASFYVAAGDLLQTKTNINAVI